MCGILGIIDTHNTAISQELLKTISHRGPDDHGMFQDEFIQLLHSRLAILDPSLQGHQPMLSEDGNFVLLFNGEIYNHPELRKDLEGKYTFHSGSDTETLLYAFIEEGREILNKLKGIFAFAIYNKSTGDLFLARDQFGVKPLYYYQKKGAFLFGSELKSFVAYPDFDKSVDPGALLNYIHFGFSPGEITPFSYVKKLLPGHYLELNVKKPQAFSVVKYYEAPFNGNYFSKTETALIQELDNKLTAAIKRQLLSDVPVAFFLSGGLDSSALVAIVRKMYPDKKIQCFTIATRESQEKEGFSDDLRYAKLVAKHLNVDLEIVEFSDPMGDRFDKIIYHLDEPQADSAPFHLHAISERARQMGYKVLISGTGGDDIFSGYRRHQALYYEKYFKYTPGFLLTLFRLLLIPFKVKRPAIRRLKKVFMTDIAHKNSRLLSYYSLLPLKKIQSLFSDNFKKEILHYDPSAFMKELLYTIPDESSDLNRMLFWEIKTYLPDHNLNYTDKISMMSGVEVRVPFLDRELVQFSTRIPPSLKMKGATTKYLLRKLMEQYLPKEVVYRSKTGFGIPPSQLLQKELRPKVKSYLSEKTLVKRGIFNPEKVQALIREHEAGYIDASYPIWALLAIESWHRQFVDSIE